ncbi:WWE domain [Dillenia turbinata]|uniref:WWE domain n=1 Tax=Dillenia turbinata TaxID=194707 RepID=A0AAN8W241_9MAGN
MAISMERVNSDLIKQRDCEKNGRKTIGIEIPIKSLTSTPSSSSSNPGEECDQAPNTCSTRLLLQNHSNFKKSASPSKLMFYQDESWVDFTHDVVSIARSSFLEGKPVVEASIDGSSYVFDFLRMVQIDLESGYQRSIAWIDETSKCFFPRLFVGEEDRDRVSKFPNVEIKIHIDTDFAKRKRDLVGEEEQEDEDELSSSNNELKRRQIEVEKKPRWSNSKLLAEGEKPYSRVNEPKRGVWLKRKKDLVEEEEEEDEDEISPSNNELNRRQIEVEKKLRWPNSKLLAEGEKPYSRIKTMFVSAMKKNNHNTDVTVTSIHRLALTGLLETARFEVFRKQLEITRAARGMARPALAWYATSADGVLSIIKHGFSLPSKVSEYDTHGIGIYLSPFSSPLTSVLLIIVFECVKSAMWSEADIGGEKHVMLCQVILGNVEKVDKGSKQSCPSNLNFDSGVDDLNDPKWYVVWCANMNSHILPEYIVSYKSSDKAPGQLQDLTVKPRFSQSPDLMFGQLCSVLEGSLPDSKVHALKNLCMAYRARKVTKDLFIKLLRSIVGDEMLLKVIHEIRGLK